MNELIHLVFDKYKSDNKCIFDTPVPCYITNYIVIDLPEKIYLLDLDTYSVDSQDNYERICMLLEMILTSDRIIIDEHYPIFKIIR